MSRGGRARASWEALAPPARDLAAVATAWGDEWWDPRAALLWNPDRAFEEQPTGRRLHLVPQSAWYALALLLRGERGDQARAVRTIEAVLATQLVAPGEVWHGTFARFLEWPEPPADATVWVDYDPNWRQFVGTALRLVLLDLPEGLPAPLVAAMDAAVGVAVDGEPPGRVPASYSNIALMKAWLEVEHGTVAGRPDLVTSGERLASDVVQLFDRHGAFDEYNSPTYYGIDLFALRLWGTRSSSERLTAQGRRLEAALWEDVARFTHAGLGNLAGPWTRSYGMDMGSYVGALALWVWSALGRDAAPFPPAGRAFEHGHDLFLGGPAALLGADIPEAAAAELQAFSGERLVQRVLGDDPPRVATAWLGERVMLGGETAGAGWSAWGQHHPVTAHWRAPDGSVGWLRLRHRAPVQAHAGRRALQATCWPHPRHGPQPVVVEVRAPGLAPEALHHRRWALPGLVAEVSSDAEVAGIEAVGDDVLAVRHRPVAGPVSWRLEVVDA